MSTSATIQVAINAWGGGGDTGFFSLEVGDPASEWDRTDPKGFVMAVQVNDIPNPIPYYVLAGDTITVDYRGNGVFVVNATNNGVSTTLTKCQRGA
jgi:hypothetical protein